MTKVIGGRVNAQRLEILIPNPSAIKFYCDKNMWKCVNNQT